MSYNLELVIRSLQSDLKSRGIVIENNTNTKINNYINDFSEKPQIINGGAKNLNQNNKPNTKSFIKNRNEEIQFKEYIEECLYNMFMPLKTELKGSLENINNKMRYFENEILKINLMNENIRTFNSKFSKLENDYNLLSKNFNNLSSLSAKNQANYENLDTTFKSYINDMNKNLSNLKNELNKDLNNQKSVDNQNNFDNLYNNAINNEKKIIEKINALYKQKENNLSILSTNLFSRFNEYSKETEKKLEVLNNSINDIKKRLDSADNNINLLNDIPNLKEIAMNNNKEIESLKSKIETVSNGVDIKNYKEEMENTKNNIQIIKTDIEEINNLKSENKNLVKDLNEIKNNMKLFEKKINIIDGNILNLDNEINDNKKEIVLIKKGKNENKSKIDFMSVNDDFAINDKLNKLNNIIFENKKTINDLEVFWKSKIKEQSEVYNENFKNINKRMELFNSEEIKFNEENSKLIEIMSKKIVDNNDAIKNILELDIRAIYEKFEIINRNFKELNKYHSKINELDKIIKDKMNKIEN